ncbi:hypothetical protein EC9_00600 [Rosistilla ulvae]|uniref:Uncharacterized protein n=1 Tax=Rosistilla ulvae TaxID=1930277 RepID=A0A517LTE7_9BACT|nr:hypothetical protein EC9_00600 [Rosistilla ulvae]
MTTSPFGVFWLGGKTQMLCAQAHSLKIGAGDKMSFGGGLLLPGYRCGKRRLPDEWTEI